VRRYRRSATAAKLQAGFAAAMAFAVVGIATQALSGRQDGSPVSTFRVTHFQTQLEIEREQALIELPDSSSGKATVR
jgi:hypothetical protein